MARPDSIFVQDILPLFELSREDWLAQARDVARQLGRGGKPVTVDDVREKCPPPKGIDGRVMGAVFTRKEWTCVSYRRSERKECHSRPVGVFKLKEKAT